MNQEERVQGHRAYGGVLVVPCLLNDAYRCWLLADTGAARTVLSSQIAEEMELDLRRPVRHERIASVHQLAHVPAVRIDSLQVGSRRVPGLEVLVCSFPPALRVDGLLGVNFLERFNPTFEFEPAALVLR
ncbi:MAG: clan AA aspartic protease [Candidatus Latescibacteria bacterium]|nr:clan AA aspartic protease [Candidatus Latescibacterota bacterium]